MSEISDLGAYFRQGLFFIYLFYLFIYLFYFILCFFFFWGGGLIIGILR